MGLEGRGTIHPEEATWAKSLGQNQAHHLQSLHPPRCARLEIRMGWMFDRLFLPAPWSQKLHSQLLTPVACWPFMGCNPRAWLTDLFQLQRYFLPSLLLNWSWLCLVPQTSLPGPCNICCISCMYSCVLTRNIKIRDGRRQGEGDAKRSGMNANHLAYLVGSPHHCPLHHRPNDPLPVDSTSLETQIFPSNFKNSNYPQTFKGKRKQ